MTYAFAEKKTHPQELRFARPGPAGAPTCSKPSLSPTTSFCKVGVKTQGSQERRPGVRIHVDLPDCESQRIREAGVRSLHAWYAAVRCRRVPAYLTFAAPVRAKVRLIIYDREAAKDTVKEVKESEVRMGEIPLMTENGSFVINGTERVIVSPSCTVARRVLRA